MRPFALALILALAFVACNEAADTASTGGDAGQGEFDAARAWKTLEYQVAWASGPPARLPRASSPGT